MQGFTGFDKSLFTPDKLEFKKDASMLKGGLVYADYITTVSETYAEEIKIKDGEILVIDSRGVITWDHFTPPVSTFSFSSVYDFWPSIEDEPTGYRKYMIDYAVTLGIPKAELEWLHHAGYTTYDIEEAIFSKNYRTICLMESGYYDELEDELYELDYDCLKNYAWT